jgi:glycosyltransferase involved in cell wall biosynthesis
VIRLLLVNFSDPTLSGATTTLVEVVKRSRANGMTVDVLEVLFKGDRGLLGSFPELRTAVGEYEVVELPFRKGIWGRAFAYLFRNTLLRLLLRQRSSSYDFVTGFRTRKSVNLIFAVPYIEFPLSRFYMKLARNSNFVEAAVWLMNLQSHYRHLRKSSQNVCVGEPLRRELQDRFGITCIALEPPAGVDGEVAERVKGRRTGKVYDALHVARQGPVKGTPDAVEVFKRLRERGYSRTALVGPVDAGVDIESLIRGTGISYLGPFQDRSSLYSLFTESRLMVYPSYLDSFGITVAEALANGVPVVAYDIPALRHYFGSCRAVRLVEKGDREALLRESLNVLEGQDLSEEAEKCGLKFSWDQVTRSLVQILAGFRTGP